METEEAIEAIKRIAREYDLSIMVSAAPLCLEGVLNAQATVHVIGPTTFLPLDGGTVEEVSV